jgi:hypothetical protein
LILEIWELTTNSTTLSTRVLQLKEYLQKDLENDGFFYKEAMGTFLTKVLSLNDIHRREKHIPSKACLKHTNSCCSKTSTTTIICDQCYGFEKFLSKISCVALKMELETSHINLNNKLGNISQ